MEGGDERHLFDSDGKGVFDRIERTILPEGLRESLLANARFCLWGEYKVDIQLSNKSAAMDLADFASRV